MNKKITLFNTYIHTSAFKNVKSVLDSGFLSEGKLVKEFEKELSEKLGLTNPVAVNSGTSALHLALVLAGVGPGDEVILPSQTFIATGLAVLYVGAKPVFADIEYDTGNIDPKDIKRKITKKTKAIIPVHWNGYPCDLDEINKIAKGHKLIVIEDAARALGATYKGKPIGSLSHFTCFSFQAIKHLTTGDGGAICSKNLLDAKKSKTLRWFGINREKAKPSLLGERIFNISEIGYKYHLNDYAAAFGSANLENFKKRIAKRQRFAAMYKKALGKIPGIQLFKEDNYCKSAYFLFGLHVERRNNFIRALKDKGIPTTIDTFGLNHHKVFSKYKTNLPVNKKFNETQINLPVHDGLTEKKIKYIIDIIKKGG